MMKYNDQALMKAIAICYNPYLKPEEAMIYCNLDRTQLAMKCGKYGIFKNNNGYYKKDDLDLILSGAHTKYEHAVKKIRL